jgi:hypothetical protein
VLLWPADHTLGVAVAAERAVGQVEGDHPAATAQTRAELIQGVDQSVGQGGHAGQVGADGLAGRLVTEAEPEAADDGGERPAQGGDEQEQVEQAGGGGLAAVGAAGQGAWQDGAGRLSHDGRSDGRIRPAQGDTS